jgi:hypothetical protein
VNDNWIRNDLTIGEVAGILDIPAKMLRYWDEIGLLKPHSINEMNGYRYYSSSQFYLPFHFCPAKILAPPAMNIVRASVRAPRLGQAL